MDWQELVTSTEELQVPRDGWGWMGKRWGKRKYPSLVVQELKEEREGPKADPQAYAHKQMHMHIALHYLCAHTSHTHKHTSLPALPHPGYQEGWCLAFACLRLPELRHRLPRSGWRQLSRSAGARVLRAVGLAKSHGAAAAGGLQGFPAWTGPPRLALRTSAGHLGEQVWDARLALWLWG